MLLKEGEIRIPAGCAISGFISRDGNRMNGGDIVKSISYMHDRSNGLGGGFAGYGIYPEYKDYYAFHVFYNSNEAREQTERFLDRHFDVINLSRIPTKKIPAITNEPLIWRYFVNPLPTKIASSQLDEKEFVAKCVIRINTSSAHPATILRSEVGGYRPNRVSRLESADNAIIAATKGAKPSKYGSIFVRTRFSVVSTIHSAMS